MLEFLEVQCGIVSGMIVVFCKVFRIVVCNRGNCVWFVSVGNCFVFIFCFSFVCKLCCSLGLERIKSSVQVSEVDIVLIFVLKIFVINVIMDFLFR